jgi:hypothetical protein
MRASGKRLANRATMTWSAGVSFLVNDVRTVRALRLFTRSKELEGAPAPVAPSPLRREGTVCFS